MHRTSFTMAFLACFVLVILPVVPVRADMLISSDQGSRIVSDPSAEPVAQAETSTVAPVDSMRVGDFLSGEEWWEVPLGFLFIVAAGWGVYHFATQPG
jgi:hypothetical protein